MEEIVKCVECGSLGIYIHHNFTASFCVCDNCRISYKPKASTELAVHNWNKINIEKHIIRIQKCSMSDIQRTFNLNYPSARTYIDEIERDNCVISDGLTSDVNYHIK